MDASIAPHASQPASFEQELARKLAACRAELERDPRVALRVRKNRLNRLLALVQEGRSALLAAVEADFGRRSAFESETIELLPLTMALRHAIRHLSGWMSYGQRSTHWGTWPSRAAVDYVPLGVIGIMSPWNYPLILSLGPAIGALAAGNRVIFKPSEAVPETNAVMAKLLENHFAPEEMCMVQGGVQEAKAFAAAPWDHLVFTGSTPVGQQVAKTAAQRMVPVTLELGGCCPAWLDPKAPLKPALEALLRGKLVNAGQTCVSPNHLYCPASRLEELLAEAPKVAKRMYPQGVQDPHYTSLIHEGHAKKISGWVENAKSAGTRWVPLLEPGPLAHNCILPGILVDPEPGLEIACHEIFGPILVVRSYQARGEELPAELAQELVSRPHPLAVHVFSESNAAIERIRGLARTGAVVVNGPLVHVGQDSIPFGGLGESGTGHYHGQEGFLRFSHHRSYYRQLRPNGINLVFPPYNQPLKHKVLALLRRFG